MYFVFSLLHSLTIQLFNSNGKYKFSELYIASLLSGSHFSLVCTLLIVLGVYETVTSFYILIIGPFLYSTWGIATLYQSKLIDYIKSALAYLLSFIFFMVIIAFLSGVYSSITESKQITKQQGMNQEQVRISD